MEIPASVAGSKTWREMAAHGTYFSSSKLSLRGTLSSRCESKTLKLIRFGEAGRERPGVLLDDGSRLDVSDFVPDCDEAFFARGGMESLRDWLNSPFSSAPRVPSTIRLGSPISRPSKIICIGLNYRDHAAETGAALPKEPVIFFKATTSLVGPNDALVIPRNATKVNWEVELALVVAKTAFYVPTEKALDHVAGYVLHNNYSEHSFQLERGGQSVKGKSADTFAPLGPFLASPDELRDPRNLKMWLKVDGETHQNSSTANMIFEVAPPLSYVSEFMTLLPADVISTGTPAGLELGLKPPQYLKSGDVVELGIEGLGKSQQRVVNFSEPGYSKTV